MIEKLKERVVLIKNKKDQFNMKLQSLQNKLEVECRLIDRKH